MAYERKTISHWEIQGDYGDGFECLSANPTRLGALNGKREYRDNCPGVALRIKEVRESRSDYATADLLKLEREAIAELKEGAKRRFGSSRFLVIPRLLFAMRFAFSHATQAPPSPPPTTPRP